MSGRNQAKFTDCVTSGKKQGNKTSKDPLNRSFHGRIEHESDQTIREIVRGGSNTTSVRLGTSILRSSRSDMEKGNKDRLRSSGNSAGATEKKKKKRWTLPKSLRKKRTSTNSSVSSSEKASGSTHSSNNGPLPGYLTTTATGMRMTSSSSASGPSGIVISAVPTIDEHSRAPSNRPRPSSAGAPAPRRQSTPSNMVIPASSAVNSSGLLEDAEVSASYRRVPILETTKLPRGGITIETSAVGRVQFGIPPETIKDSMRLGFSVPTVYIVPVERFCREMGPALGVNLAEFEFPAYFNFFVLRRKCMLVVDSFEAEKNIRKVFSETLLGPAQFRKKESPVAYQEEDFDPSFSRDAIPNFAKELKHFRIMPNGKELDLETLLEFAYFETPTEEACESQLGVPPPLRDEDKIDSDSNDRNDGQAPGRKGSANGSKAPKAEEESDDKGGSRKNWTYSQVKWVGDVATVFAPGSTEEEIKNRSCKRVEIFKMPGGTEYVLHDIDEKNHIVGRSRFSGHVRVPESVSVTGFKADTPEDQSEETITTSDRYKETGTEVVLRRNDAYALPPTFHPPSFGVTVLGNSHGFDKSGSTSGYVLWINGRGVMIDPPPYSSATLEREGIRPRTIVGIILTHCHADHDAGAFQKVLTGSPVVVITTPTIYESFIRKYAALSALSPALLRHSHRFKAAIIGQPLRFQGATFHFTYTLHSIPCVGFRVEWRGRSMVFTGDHMNIPAEIDKLQEKGVLTKARADDLRNLPLQETDLLLHESGAPPIHTPLDVLLQLPPRVKHRLYVVHTSALPDGCELRVAPTGTDGTIRLDQLTLPDTGNPSAGAGKGTEVAFNFKARSAAARRYSSINEETAAYEFPTEDLLNEYSSSSGLRSFGGTDRTSSSGPPELPLVAIRPTSSTDAWFILNLLSAVPFMSSLSYSSAMEVLETARVDAYCVNDIVVPANRRRDVLCVVWEGTCMEREQTKGEMLFVPKEKMESKNAKQRRISSLGHDHQGRHDPITEKELLTLSKKKQGAVWYAGDWTGPRSLQPEKRISGESSLGKTHDIVAMSSEGVKVITIEYSNLNTILKSGSPLYRKYLARKKQQVAADSDVSIPYQTAASQMQKEAMKNLNIIELLDCNSSLRKLNAVQKRHLESLAEGPVFFAPGQRLWRAGQTVDRAYIVVAGTVAFVPKRRQTQESKPPPAGMPKPRSDSAAGFKVRKIDLNGDLVSLDERDGDDNSVGSDLTEAKQSDEHMERLQAGLKKRAENMNDKAKSKPSRRSSSSTDASFRSDLHDYGDLIHDDDESMAEEGKMGLDSNGSARRRSSKDRFANKVLGRMYSRRAFTAGLVFSRGHFLGDVSKMVAGLLSVDYKRELLIDDDSVQYGFGDVAEGKTTDNNASLSEMTIHEQESDRLVVHSSTLAAGKEGCSVIIFPKASLIPFLDDYPGLLLSLLGTQVVV